MIHDYYNRITPATKNLIDSIFTDIFKAAKEYGVSMSGSDAAEYAVEAMAKWFYESRQAEQASRVAKDRELAQVEAALTEGGAA